ncbi:MAG: rRNA maturation RNase YbeY [Patescibacteria group bacterium]
MDTFSLKNATRSSLPRVAFSVIKEKILGGSYALSVVFVGEKRMRDLNATYRKKNTPTDILSFPLSKNSGEIVLHMRSVTKKASLFSLSPRAYLAYVFIHGCLHLKGYTHGRTMEKLEDRWLRAFKLQKPLR